VAGHAFRRIRTGALVVALAFGGSAWATAAAYAATFPTESSRREAAALVGGDAAIRVLLGPVDDIATVGGYLVYKNFVFLTLVGAVWGLLAATRLLRGEEDAGRAQLVLAGAVRPSRATAAALVALALAVAVVFTGTAALTLLAARDPALGLGSRATLLYAASLVIAPAVFAAVGAVTSQLARSRRQATALGLTVLAAAFAVRMVADAGTGTRWLHWATPFGWTELVRPFTADDAWPLLPAALTVLALGAAAIVLSDRRDTGEGILGTGDDRPPRAAGLSSVTGLALRLELPVLLAWCAGAAATGALTGVFLELTAGGMPDSLQDNLGRYGVTGSPTDQFLGVVFLLIGTVVALLPAGQVGAAAEEETSGRLVHVLARPVPRRTWLLGRIVVTGAAVVAAALLGGFGVWLAAGLRGFRLDLLTLLGAGLNVVPTALVCLGAGAVVLAVAPRAAGPSVYAVVVWSVFADLVAPLVPGAAWLGNLSVFHAMALFPGEPVSAAKLVALTVTGVLLCVAAVALVAHRDVRAD
jgi:ABC-2 type transport system permease protein